MGIIMDQFNKTVEEIKKSRRREELLMDKLRRDVCELGTCIHRITEAAVNNRDSCFLTTITCPESYANELSSIGFNVNVMEDDFGILGYTISW